LHKGSLLRERDELRDALREIIGQADAQFHAGDRHATFHRQTIDSFRNLLA